MQILLDIKMPPSSLEQFKVLDNLEKNNQKSLLEIQKSQKRTKERKKKKSIITEKGNLKVNSWAHSITILGKGQPTPANNQWQVYLVHKWVPSVSQELLNIKMVKLNNYPRSGLCPPSIREQFFLPLINFYPLININIFTRIPDFFLININQNMSEFLPF